MSEKQLSKSAWEQQAKKFKLDEKLLSKALAAYEKCDEKDLKAREDALKAIEKAAEGLKKDKEYKEAAGYLGEVITAAGQALKTLAKEEEKEEAEGEEDEESAAYKKDLGQQLKAALSQVKGRAPGEPGADADSGPKQLKFLAYIAGGSSAVIVGKKVGGGVRKLAASIAGTSGGKYLDGDCIFEKNAYTFVLDQAPGGLAAKLSKALLEETGQKYKVRVRSVDGLTESDDETEAVPPVPPPPPPPSVPPTAEETATVASLRTLKLDLEKVVAAGVPSAADAKTLFVAVAALIKERRSAEAAAKMPDVAAAIQKALAELGGPAKAAADAEAAFKARLTALMPKIKEAIGSGTPAGQEIRLKASEAGAVAKQHDFAQAGALLDQVEALLGGDKAANEEALFKQRLTALMPKIKEAMAAATPAGQAIRLKAAEAAALGKQHEYGKANGLLSEIEILLGAPSASTGTGERAERPFSLVSLQKSRLAWNSLRNEIQAQLQELEQKILAGVRAHNEDETAEDEFEEGEVGAAVKKLYSVLDKLDERLIDKLDEALNAKTDAERRTRHQEAGGIIKEYQAFAANDPTLLMIDENGFTQTTIRSAVAKTLTELAGKF